MALVWPRRSAEPDPHAAHIDRYQTFIDQGRWLLDQQQKRGAAFQQTATTLVGFDGVLLAVLVAGDPLDGWTRYSTPWWAFAVAGVMLVLSAAAGVLALVPRQTPSVDAEDAIKAWARFCEEAGWREEEQHFAHMIFTTEAVTASGTRGQGTTRSWWAARPWRRIPQQALLAAEHLATVRGRWATAAGGLLVSGLTAMLIGFVATSAAAVGASPS